ncbi:MAG: hypothetical protein ACJASZ_002606 [Yoonia sp.]|jgi:hypothetical protein
MKFGTTFAIGLLVASFSAATSASAATCANRTEVVDRLETRFGEAPIANAISASNNVLEVFAKPNSETWTVLLSLPTLQLTCLVASGRGNTVLQAFLQEI